ncbi:MAG: adenylate/guanylate cyclase domain-containing protein [Elusimicrobiota bacterium]
MVILKGIAGACKDKQYELGNKKMTLGRGRENSVILEDYVVSRNHAKLEQLEGKVVITDTGSRNGTFVNDERVKERVLKNNDRIKIGESVFLINITEEEEKEEETISSFTVVKPIELFKEDVSITESGIKEIKNVFRMIEEKSYTQEEFSHAYKNLFVVWQVAKALGKSIKTEMFLEMIIDLVFEVLDVKRGSISLIDETTGDLVPKVIKVSDSLEGSGFVKSISKTITRKVIDEKVAVITTDATQDARFRQGESIILQNIRSAMCVPLWSGKKITGIIYVDNYEKPDIFNESDLNMLSALSNQAAVAIENLKLNEKINEEEIYRRHLQRYISPRLVEEIIGGKKIPTLGGTKTKATVLFTDIRNFTTLSEGLDTDDILALLNKHFSAMTDILFKYDGTLDKYIGDGLMAVFGVPFCKEDDALRAVKCAIEMQNTIIRTNEIARERGEIIIGVGIGINTGEVTAGNMGSPERMEYTVIGDTVNTSSRIVSRAASGQILINETTYREVKDLIDADLVGNIEVKGKRKPLSLYLVKGIK